MKKSFNSYSDFTPIQKADFGAVQQMAFDVQNIHNFLTSSLQTTDSSEIRRLYPLVESIVSLIKTHIHESENFENSENRMGDN